jgi:cell division protein FtsL
MKEVIKDIETKEAGSDGFFSESGSPYRIVPLVAFLAVLGMVYIWITNSVEKNLRKINTIQREVKDLRAEYITLKSEQMSASKQSDVAAKLKEQGVEELTSPPTRIVIEKK